MMGPALLQIPDRSEADMCQVGEFLLRQPRGAAMDANQWTYPRAIVLWLGPGLVRHPGTLILPAWRSRDRRPRVILPQDLDRIGPSLPEPIYKEWYAGSLIFWIF
jgi:hypothetical protein